ARQSADDGTVFHFHKAGQTGAVGDDGAVAHDAVVPDVGVGHDEVAVADHRLPPAARGPPVNGDPFPDDVVVADAQPGGLTPVTHVLGIAAQARPRADPVPAADHGRALHHHMGPDVGVVADFHIFTYHGVRSHPHALPQPRPRS